MIKKLLLCILIVSVIFFSISFLKGRGVVYTCDENRQIEAKYRDNKVNIVLSDKREFTLNHTLSASGTRYTNKNKNVVFWSKERSALLEENNQTTYQNCVEKY